MTSTNVRLWLVAGACLLFATCGLKTPREGWNTRWGPLVPHKTFPADCSLCHVPDRWDVLRDDFAFDHAKETGHALEGAHARAACLRCHNDFGPVKAYTARGCAGCHTDIHRGTLTGECEQCHNQDNWRPGGLVAEHARTRFPLFGAHLVAACEQCHTRAPTGDYRSAPTECAACHREDLAQALNPDHQAQGWTTSCERCHVPVQWKGAGFTHTFFPLSGGHAIDCSRCHTNGRFEKLPTNCVSCHRDDYDRAANHEDFPTTCEDCHTIDRWEGARFAHTTFPLRGGHRNLDCRECHTTNNPPAFSCIDCHEHRRSEVDDEHDDVRNYRYESQACFQCHPDGDD